VSVLADAFWLYHEDSQHLEHSDHRGLCMALCGSQNITDGLCAMETTVGQLAVHWQNCSDTPLQRWSQVSETTSRL
jgi:hypothetical protein